MAANLPPNGPALLTVGAIAVLLQAWLTSSPTVPPAYQAEMPRKPEAVQDAAAAKALRSSVEASNPAAESMRMLDTAAPDAHQYGTQGWHDVRRASSNGAAGKGADGEGAAADGKGAARSEAQENEPRPSGRSSWRPPSPHRLNH